ncbi:hypothetical protein ACWIG5_27170 [Streptomyces lydicus]
MIEIVDEQVLGALLLSDPFTPGRDPRVEVRVPLLDTSRRAGLRLASLQGRF